MKRIGFCLAPGALDPLTKELLYVTVSVTNGCECATGLLGGS